jgi:hypothetical protein
VGYGPAQGEDVIAEVVWPSVEQPSVVDEVENSVAVAAGGGVLVQLGSVTL